MNRFTGSDLLRWTTYSLLSSYGIILVCFVLNMILGSISQPVDRFLDRATFAPTFAIPILFGLFAGYRFGSALPKFQSRMVFLLPLLMAAYELSVWTRYTYAGENVPASIRDNFLTTNCGSSECLEAAIVTAPLFSSVAFAVGSEIRRFVLSRKSVSDV